MTQEDKAKRYDEVFNAAKEWYNNPNSSNIGKSYLYAVFPELKDSEDEKIRESIIENLKGNMCRTDGDYDLLNKQIAWLEKQGENHDDKYNITGIKSKHAEGKLGEMIKEIKSTDKVETKFHEGEWIVWQDKFYKVNYNGCGYELVAQNGLSTSLEYGTIDENAHLFSIKDAKDGDILASKSGDKIFSYRGNLDLRGNPCAYYGIYKVHDGICFSPCAIGNSFTHEEVFPATKEQRKILFEERTTAGGVLHFSKKELNWKPSDEQMDALQYVYKNLNPPLADKLGWDSLKTLELLYQDLKKL